MTKIVDVTLGQPGGSPTREGWLILNYSAPDGGRTQVGAPIIARDGVFPTWNDVAALLLNNLGRNEWPKFITGKLSRDGNAVRLSIPDDVDDVVFSAEFNPTVDQTGATEASPDFVTIAEEAF